MQRRTMQRKNKNAMQCGATHTLAQQNRLYLTSLPATHSPPPPLLPTPGRPTTPRGGAFSRQRERRNRVMERLIPTLWSLFSPSPRRTPHANTGAVASASSGAANGAAVGGRVTVFAESEISELRPAERYRLRPATAAARETESSLSFLLHFICYQVYFSGIFRLKFTRVAGRNGSQVGRRRFRVYWGSRRCRRP